MNEEKVRKPNFYVAVIAMQRGVETYSAGLRLECVWGSEDLAFLEERKKTIPTPLAVVVQLRPHVILLLFGARL